MYENEYISIGKAAKLLGVSVPTLRRWERAGKLISCFRTFGNHRRYKLSDIFRISNKENKKVVCYSRVSSYDQKEDLERQNDKLMHFSTQKFNNIESIKDLGSGLNFKKKGLNKLIMMILNNEINHIVINHKERYDRILC
tara:strand:- start:196 stop:615 length:420 start_codon:yes stop_codon:yes gene_type:complete